MRLSRRQVRARTVVALSGFGLALAIAGALAFQPSPSPANPAPTQASIATLAGHFALLRAPAGAPPPPAIVAATGKAPAAYALNLAAAREASGGTWLVPGKGWLCIGTMGSEGAGMSCTTSASAEVGELIFSVRDVATGEEQIIGAAPDGAATVTASNPAGVPVAAGNVSESVYELKARNVAKMTLGGGG